MIGNKADRWITFFLLVLFLSIPLCAETRKASVVLISVATEDENFWSGIHASARSAAADLGIRFSIRFSDRNHYKAVQIAEEIAAQNEKPDYVIVTGEKLIASQSIPILTSVGITVLVYGDLTAKEKTDVGEPGEKFTLYLGKRIIDDYAAGYLTAELMINEAERLGLHDDNGKLNFLGFEGVHMTSFNSERVRGLNDVFKKYPNSVLLQTIPTDWTFEYARKILPNFLHRYYSIKIAGYWCANSDLAMGCVDYLKSIGMQPGVDFVTTGIDWSKEAVDAVISGDLISVAGGHVLSVAWLLVLIHDYHNGYEFSKDMFLNNISLMTRNTALIFSRYFSDNDWSHINFKMYSKAENPALEDYDLSFEAVFRNLDP